MTITDKEAEHILNLSRCDKPKKRVKQYVNSLLSVGKEERIEMLHKMYIPFFKNYFKSFAGGMVDDCIMEAYVEALASLENDLPLEVALRNGFKRGNLLHRVCNKELYGEEYD